MKLDSLWVEGFKNLRNFKVDFDENPQELFAVLLGRNGSGKSNLLEVLVVIFRDLFRGSATEFGYELRYTLQKGEVKICVKNQPADSSPLLRFRFTITKDGISKELKRDDLKDNGLTWLPRHVFAYYSGPSDRLEEHFRPQQKQFYRDLLKGKESPFRPMFYARPVHSNFVLLALSRFQPLTEGRQRIWQKCTDLMQLYVKAAQKQLKEAAPNPVLQQEKHDALLAIHQMLDPEEPFSSVAASCLLSSPYDWAVKLATQPYQKLRKNSNAKPN